MWLTWLEFCSSLRMRVLPKCSRSPWSKTQAILISSPSIVRFPLDPSRPTKVRVAEAGACGSGFDRQDYLWRLELSYCICLRTQVSVAPCCSACCCRAREFTASCAVVMGLFTITHCFKGTILLARSCCLSARFLLVGWNWRWGTADCGIARLPEATSVYCATRLDTAVAWMADRAAPQRLCCLLAILLCDVHSLKLKCQPAGRSGRGCSSPGAPAFVSLSSSDTLASQNYSFAMKSFAKPKVTLTWAKVYGRDSPTRLVKMGELASSAVSNESKFLFACEKSTSVDSIPSLPQ